MNLPQIYIEGDEASEKNTCDFCGERNAWDLFRGLKKKYHSMLKKKNKRYACMSCADSIYSNVGLRDWPYDDVRNTIVFLLCYGPEILLCV